MKKSNRRVFLSNTAVAGAGIAAGSLYPRNVQAQESSKSNRIAYRKLGSTGHEVTEIGFGCMNMRDPELVHAAIDRGINYIDTANSYMNGVNEEVVGSVMKTKRNSVFLTTKIKYDNSGVEIKDMPGMIASSLKRLQTDHVDLLLVHITDKREQLFREDLVKIFDEARSKGQTRFVGVSTHANQAEVLDAAVESEFWEAVLVGHNYFSPSNVAPAIERARKAGLAIIGMKNLLSMSSFPWTKLDDIREDKNSGVTAAQALIKWVLNNQNVDTVIPGMTSFEHLDENLAIMGTDLGFEDLRIINKYAELIKENYCRGVSGCTGCQNQCPKNVKVNDINRCLGYATGYKNIDLAWENYKSLPRSNRLDICADCDECVVKCINGLDLTENVKQARGLFA